MDKYIGKRLDGRYEIREIIGVGGMAYVYKAYDTIDDRIVAVKILKDEFLANEEFTRRFKNESKAIAILSHPNIVKVYDVSFGERLQYIVMEYIDGITLKEYIDQQKEIKWKEAVHFTVQILRALQHAHDKGIVHRDIKPQNIMLLPDGTIKVTDFGIARFSHSDMRVTSAADKAIGSVHYISPEQARGDVTDEKADIYSVGVMLYEMLTGKLPFEADNAVSIAIMQMQAEPIKPRDIKPDIPEGLEEITLKAMQKDPLKRYQSAAEMLNDIDEFKRNPSIHFAYKYFVDETPTRFVEAITKVKGNESNAEAGEEKAGEKAGEHKNPPVIPILAAVAGAFVLVAIIFVVVVVFTKMNSGSSTENVDLPNFVGQNYMDIMNSDYKDEFTWTEIQKSDDTVPANVVISQDPTYPRKVKKYSKVTLYVSTGPQMVEVPSFSTTENEATVKQRLIDAGLQVGDSIMKSSSDVAKGCVMELQPGPGEKVAKGSTVTMIVSNGPDPVSNITVPNVINATIDSATNTLRGDGFIVNDNDTQRINSKLPANTVISTNPNSGTQQQPGTEVKLTVSSGYQDATINITLPDTDKPIDLQVRIDGVVDTSYTHTNIIPKDFNPKFTFTKQENQYTVVFQIRPTGSSDYQDYLKYTVYGSSGGDDPALVQQWPYTEPTDAPTTTTQRQTTTPATQPTKK